MEFLAAYLAAVAAWMVVAFVTVAVLAGLLFPAFWVWMLVDSILREPWEYPHGGPNEKLVWVLVIALIQPAAIAYLLFVWARRRRGTAPAPAGSLPTSAAVTGAAA